MVVELQFCLEEVRKDIAEVTKANLSMAAASRKRYSVYPHRGEHSHVAAWPRRALSTRVREKLGPTPEVRPRDW